MSGLKQTIKRDLIYTLSLFVALSVWDLIKGKDIFTAAKDNVPIFLIALLCLIISEAAYFYQTKKFI